MATMTELTADIKTKIDLLLREGFDSAATNWRDNARIVPVPDFKPLVGFPQPSTYARLLILTNEEITSGAYEKRVREMGRGIGTKFRVMFNEYAENGRPVVVTFLHGEQYPCVNVQYTSSGLEVRGYYDFGMCPGD